jgi:hypothetical protein
MGVDRFESFLQVGIVACFYLEHTSMAPDALINERSYPISSL